MSRKTKKNLPDAERATRIAAQRKGESNGRRELGRAESSVQTNLFISDRAWLWLSLAVLLVAAVFRLYALELKPLHHDEGVNGFFLTNLVRQGRYVYDPSNYHGPTLYYLTLPLTALLGLETWALRLLTVIFGLGLVALPLLMSRYIGRLGALVAAALLAVSPGAIYFSRYYIHEIPFVFFTLAAVVAWLRFAETARGVYLMLAAVSLALLFATKETAFISVGVLLIAWAMTRFYMRLRHTGDANAAHDTTRFDVKRVGGANNFAVLLAGGVVIFVVVNVLFYSSFFTNAKGVTDAIKAYAIWQRTGTSDFHAKPFGTYLIWLLKEETALFLLGMTGALWALLRAKSRFAVFVALWAGGITLAYSIVKYKTPWLALNFLPPFAIVAGCFVEDIARLKIGRDSIEGAQSKSAPRAMLIVVALVIVALGVGGYRSLRLNFFSYDDDRFAYVYAHSTRDLTTLDRDVARFAERRSDPASLSISIHSADYWPLPWYFRDYKVTGYPPQQLAGASADILILSTQQAAEANVALGSRYGEVGRYRLRPGVEIVLFARRDLTN